MVSHAATTFCYSLLSLHTDITFGKFEAISGIDTLYNLCYLQNTLLPSFSKLLTIIFITINQMFLSL